MGKVDRIGIVGILSLAVAIFALPPEALSNRARGGHGAAHRYTSTRQGVHRSHYSGSRGPVRTYKPESTHHGSIKRHFGGSHQGGVFSGHIRSGGDRKESLHRKVAPNTRGSVTKRYYRGTRVRSLNHRKQLRSSTPHARRYEGRGTDRSYHKKIGRSSRRYPNRDISSHNPKKKSSINESLSPDRRNRDKYPKNKRYPKHKRHRKHKHIHKHKHRHYYGYLIYPGFYHYGFPGFYWDSYYPYVPTYSYPVYESTMVYKEDPVDYGLLRLFVQPEDTEIFVDGEFLGLARDVTDRAFSVQPGEHRVELRSGGFSRYFDVYVSPGATTFFGKDLTLEGSAEEYSEDLGGPIEDDDSSPTEVNNGLVVIRVEPEDAEIFINDRSLGSAQGLAEAGIILPEGSHIIRAKASGYLPYEETLQVSADEPIELNIEMVQQGGLTQ